MSGPFRPSRTFRSLVRGLACAIALSGSLVSTLPAQADTTHLQIASRDIGASQRLALGLNKSMIVDLPVNVHEMIVSQPAIVSAVVRTKKRVILQGVGAGDTNIIFLDAAGQSIAVLDLRVTKEVSPVGSALEIALARIVPNSAIRVESLTVGDASRVVLSGTVASEDDFKRATEIAVQYAGDPANVANLTTIAGAQQVMLHVTIAEVSRDTVKQLGINLSGALTVGSVNLGLNSSQTALANGVNGGVNVPGFQLTAALRALEQRGAVRTLAEPTLTALSGKPADFLAGGQVPVLSSIDTDGTRAFELKDIGVKLKFVPTIRSNGIIGLEVGTEVTEIAENGFDTGQGIISGFNTRSANTTVEMRNGETLAIAGLIQDKLRQQISGLPGFANIPILGALFRSREFQRSQTELVILVTPYLAQPQLEAGPLPTDSYVPASDAEAIFLGQMEKTYGIGEGPGGMRGSFSGSVGFVLD